MKNSPFLAKYSPYLFVIAIALVFFIGSSWQEIKNLGGSFFTKPTPTQQESEVSVKLSVEDLKGYAKQIGLDTNKFNSCLDSDKYKSKIETDIQYAADELSVAGTPGFYLNGHYIDGTLPYSSFKEIIDFELSGGDWKKAPPNITDKANSATVEIDTGGSQAKGNSNAPVTLIEFADFECPFCEQFFREVEPQIMKDYVETGKVYFIFMNYPIFLSHPNAVKAAEAGECAAEQGKFWEMHDLMFKSQQ